MKKILTIAAASLVLLSSCRSTEEGAVNGAMFGSMAGRAIGGITNGYYGEHIGSLVGMVAGGAAGAAVGHAEETKREKRVAELHRKHIERERRKAERQRRKAGNSAYGTYGNGADDVYAIGGSKSNSTYNASNGTYNMDGSSVAQQGNVADPVETVSISALNNSTVNTDNTQYVGTYNVSNGTYTANGNAVTSVNVSGQTAVGKTDNMVAKTESKSVGGKTSESITIDKPTENTVRKDDESGFDPTNSGNDVIDFE